MVIIKALLLLTSIIAIWYIMSIVNTNVMHVGTAEAKHNLSEIINKVSYGGERVVITSRGKPKVALVTLNDLKQIGASVVLSDPKKESRLKALDQADLVREEIKKSGKLKHDPVELLSRMRLERDKKLISNLH